MEGVQSPPPTPDSDYLALLLDGTHPECHSVLLSEWVDKNYRAHVHNDNGEIIHVFTYN